LIQPRLTAFANGTQMAVLKTSTASLSASVRASLESMVANRKLSAAPCVSMLRTYVRTVHMKIEIQKSVKNPYLCSNTSQCDV
jgi:hypothetical protein